MRSAFAIALRLTLVMTALTGIAYPAAVTLVAQLAFPRQARGSLVTAGGRVVGSELIGQRFTSPGYFHPRPSAAGAGGYDATASGGSNLGPTSRALHDRVEAAAAAYRDENGLRDEPIPPDAVTASGSGLDPHISPANALLQSARVARSRGVAGSRVLTLVEECTEGPWLGLFGEPRVNVLRLNLALDARVGRGPEPEPDPWADRGRVSRHGPR